MTQETQPTSKRFRIAERTEFGIDLEYNDDFAILHIAWVSKFNKTIYQDMLDGFEDLKNFIETMGYPALHVGLPPENEVTKKLVRRLGFEYVNHHLGYDIYELELGEK